MSLSSSRRRALVTGATGFIGSHLVSKLVAEGWKIDIIVRSGRCTRKLESNLRIHLYDGSFDSVAAAVRESSPDVVFHLASLFVATHEPTHIAPLVESNILFGTHLLEAMSAHGTGCLVNAGTCWQHYRGSSYDPVCLYAATKQAFEAILAFFVNARHISAITLKLFDTYGPDDRRLKLLRCLQTAAEEGTVLQMSPGDQFLSLVHVDDIVNALLLAEDRLRSGIVNGSETYAVNADCPIRLRDLVELFNRNVTTPAKIQWGARSYRAREVMTPWADGIRLPGWKPMVTLEEGIRDLILTDCAETNYVLS